MGQGLLRLGPGLDADSLQMISQEGFQGLLVAGRGLQDLGQGAQDAADAAVPARLEQQLVSFGEVRELQPQLLERAQPAALPLDVGGEPGDLAFQVPAGLARPRSVDLRRLALGLGADLPLGGLLTANLFGAEGGLGPLALTGGHGLLVPQSLGLRGDLALPLQEGRQLVLSEG